MDFTRLFASDSYDNCPFHFPSCGIYGCECKKIAMNENISPCYMLSSHGSLPPTFELIMRLMNPDTKTAFKDILDIIKRANHIFGNDNLNNHLVFKEPTMEEFLVFLLDYKETLMKGLSEDNRQKLLATVDTWYKNHAKNY